MLQAELTRDRAATALEQLTEAAEHRIPRRHVRVHLRPRAAAAGPRGLDLATRILDRTRTKFTEGLSSSFDLTQAQNQRVSAQGSLTQATLRWLNAHLRLQRSLNA